MSQTTNQQIPAETSGDILEHNLASHRIVWRLREHDVHACLDGDQTRWGCGKTVPEAVGDVVTSHMQEVLPVVRESVFLQQAENKHPVKCVEVPESTTTENRITELEQAVELHLATIRGQAEDIKVYEGFWHQEQGEHKRLGKRVTELEDAIHEAGIILAEGELTDMPQDAISRAMQRLGSVMSKRETLSRQEIVGG